MPYINKILNWNHHKQVEVKTTESNIEPLEETMCVNNNASFNFEFPVVHWLVPQL